MRALIVLRRAICAALSFLLMFLMLALASLVFLGSFLLFGCASTPTAGLEPGDVRGCYVTFLISQGAPKPFYEPFVKVANKESFAEDGHAEVWGFRLWNLEPPDANGMVLPVNIRADRFIPSGPFKEVDGQMCRCPDYW